MSLAFTLDRFCAASPERVWASFTDPTLMAGWFCPNPSLPTSCTLDVREGGTWRCEMGPYAVAGTYVRVEPVSALSFTWAWEHSPTDPVTTVVVTLTPEDGGTRLVLEHAEVEPDVGADGHRGGWELSLSRLESALHPGSSTA